MNPLVTVDRRDGYAVVRLRRPEKKNAMNRRARGELLAALTSLCDKKAIILTGDGDSFCSGVDLKEVRSDAVNEAERLGQRLSGFDAAALAESKRALDVVPASISG
jgi:enoyl-CoA hydratase/carnithine racemase